MAACTRQSTQSRYRRAVWVAQWRRNTTYSTMSSRSMTSANPLARRLHMRGLKRARLCLPRQQLANVRRCSPRFVATALLHVRRRFSAAAAAAAAFGLAALGLPYLIEASVVCRTSEAFARVSLQPESLPGALDSTSVYSFHRPSRACFSSPVLSLAHRLSLFRLHRGCSRRVT